MVLCLLGKPEVELQFWIKAPKQFAVAWGLGALERYWRALFNEYDMAV